MRCLHCTPASAGSTSGSMSNTDAPECSTMYETSSALRRKFTGTHTRPNDDTPKSVIMNLAEFGLTMATRSPWSTPMFSSARASPRVEFAVRQGAQSARNPGLVDHSDPVRIGQGAPIEKVPDGQRYEHGCI